MYGLQTKAVTRKGNKLEATTEDFSTPDEFDEYRKKLGKLNKRKYLLLAREGIRLKDRYPQYEKGIAYALCGLGFSSSIDDIDEIAQEFGDLELPDRISTGSWVRVEELVEESLKKEI